MLATPAPTVRRAGHPMSKQTCDLFDAFLKCPTKCYLRSTSQAGSGNAYADWVRKQNDAYRAEARKRLMAGLPEAEVVVGPPAVVDLRAAQWRLAFDLPVQTGHMAARLHAVERVPSQSRGKAAQFIPVRFTFFNTLTKEDRLLATFEALVLSEAVGREISLGKIIHGDDHATLKVKVASLSGMARKKAEKMAAILGSDTPPDLVLRRHCAECEFRDRCRQKALEQDDLSLLPTLTERERMKLHGKGIFTTYQLSFTFRPRKTPKRAKNPSNPRHHALHAQAIRENAVYIHEKPHIPPSGRCLYFDIEGVPSRQSYYLIGVLAVEPEGTQYHSFWADDDDHTAMIAQFCRFVESYHDARLFHYGHYDVKALREMGRLLPEDERSKLEKILSATFNVLPVVHSHIYFPFHSIRLRQVARFLGCEFKSSVNSGLESIVFREKWRKSGDHNLKSDLIAYNREDCEALRTLCDFIRRSVSLAEKRDRVPGRQENVVLSDCLRKPGEGNRPVFKKAEFVLPEFEKINLCAYFDYQREKVYARAKRKPVAGNHRRSHTMRRPSQDTEVVVKCDTCGYCGSKRLSLRSTFRRRLIDLKFYKTGIGVKRWQPHYVIHRQRCRSCGAHLIPPGIVNPERKTIYGHNLMCWCVYHNVVCKQSLLQVERSLEDIFGLRLPYKNVYRFRSAIAAHYRPLRDEILDAILGSGVVNIDETPVNLRKSTGYVWVLATHDKVCYLYKDSREGGFLKELQGLSPESLSRIFSPPTIRSVVGIRSALCT